VGDVIPQVPINAVTGKVKSCPVAVTDAANRRNYIALCLSESWYAFHVPFRHK
jgi:hypothetical protein